MTPSTRSKAGFTLIELMIVVAIMAILASVAIPNYTRLTTRAKTAERSTVMQRLKAQIQGYYIYAGTSVPPSFGATTLISEWNPPLLPGTEKRMLTRDAGAVPNWAQYFAPPPGSTSISVDQELEGAMYYSYSFIAIEPPGAPQIFVLAVGDLDGDGALSTKQLEWTRSSGSYQQTGEIPPFGEEDVTTF